MMIERLMLLGFLTTVTSLRPEFEFFKSSEVIFEWESIDFQWPSDEERESAIKNGDYIPANNFIVAAKFWKDKMYLTLPRWNDGVPVTLGVTSAEPINGITAPRLEAFPNWTMQKLDDCAAFQLVHSIEIDPKGRMWVLDTGRPTFLRESKAECSPRLVILDLEDNGKILHSYQFPERVASRTNAYLNDIVLDHDNGGMAMAYIRDSSFNDSGIIVYSLKDNNSWKVRHDSMKTGSLASISKYSMMLIKNPTLLGGIALSPASSGDRYPQYQYLFVRDLQSISFCKVNETKCLFI